MKVNVFKKDLKVVSWIVEGDCKDIINTNYFINEIEKDIKNSTNNFKTHVKGFMTSWHKFNYDPEFIKIIEHCTPMLQKIPELNSFQIRESWGLKYDNEYHYTHTHNHAIISGFSGLLYLGSEGPGTYFSDYDLTFKEEKGKILFFDKLTCHETKKYNYVKPRYTIAFNFDRTPEFF
jgi:hypothetical protein